MSTDTIKDMANLTPMLRQYYEVKAQAPDAIVFFRMGDFYEIFGDDATEIAPRLQLVLTSRERGDQQRIPFCGVPHHSARTYYLKLLKLGYKVAIAEQVEDPKHAKGLVRREICKILTPGCVDDLEGMDSDRSNYILAAYEDPRARTWAIALTDISTGELRLGSAANMRDIAGLAETYRPREILMRKFQHGQAMEYMQSLIDHDGVRLDALPEGLLRDPDQCNLLLTEVLSCHALANQPCGEVPGGKELLASLIYYLKGLHACLDSLLVVRPIHDPGTMLLNETAVRDLEIFATSRRGKVKGSLFGEVNATLSPMGARLLRQFLLAPLRNIDEIAARHQAVEGLLTLGAQKLTDLRKICKGLGDLERLITRIQNRSANPQDLCAVRESLTIAKQLCENFTWSVLGQKLGGELNRCMQTYTEAHDTLIHALSPQPGSLGHGNEVFASGYCEELDRRNGIAQSGSEQVKDYEAKLRQETGIQSLKVKPHKTFGLLIEVTKANLNKVPNHFIRRQTMVNNERFATEELVHLSESLADAKVNALAQEDQLYGELLSAIAQHSNSLRKVASALAMLDVLQSFAWQAHRHSYCRPKLIPDGDIEITACRHPVVESMVGRHNYVPNDFKIERKTSHVVLTGPNMAGKSTAMRQLSLAAILAQCGSFVPAQKATMPIFDQVFTRVGAADDLSRGQSTFMVEMVETAHILRQATKQSLVILDEVGRGTSTTDGLAIAAAVLKDLVTRVGAYSLFATHYHEMIPIAQELAGTLLLQSEVRENGQEITFTHRLISGAATSSYGLEVARLAGLPEAVIKNAHSMIKNHVAPQSPPIKGATKHSAPLPLEEHFTFQVSPEDKLLTSLKTRLREIDLNQTTPLEALNILNEISNLTLAATAVHTGHQPWQ